MIRKSKLMKERKGKESQLIGWDVEAELPHWERNRIGDKSKKRQQDKGPQ